MNVTKALFNSNASEKVENLFLQASREQRRLKDLRMLRSRIERGTLTKELYDFLNQDGSLDAFFGRLPRPSSEPGMEEFNQVHLITVDTAIAASSAALESWYDKILKWFTDWFENWWDRNRRAYNNARLLEGKWKQDHGVFGKAEEFEGMEIVKLHGPEWKVMVNASLKISQEIKTCPSKGVGKWIESKKSSFSACLKEFGMNIAEEGEGANKFYMLKVGNPTHVPSRNTCRGHRYLASEIGQNLSLVIQLLGEERATRKTIEDLKSTVKRGSEEDKRHLQFVLSLVTKSKAMALNIAMSYLTIISQAYTRFGNGAKKTDQTNNNDDDK